MMFSNLSGQNTKLLYHKKSLFGKAKYINIFFSNLKGSNSVKPEDIASSDYLYFCYKPVGEWTFKENEIYEDKELKGISIKQNGESIFNSKISPIIENSNIIMVVASFPKDKILITQPIEFYNDLDISQPIHIPEKYWSNYKTFSQYYTEGAKQFDEKKYLKSFEFLKHFITDDKEIIGLSFYDHSKKLIKQSIKYFIDDTDRAYKKLNIDIEISLTVDEFHISKLDSIYNSLIGAQQTFSLYFNSITDEESTGWQQELIELVSNVSQAVSERKESFKTQKLSLFEVDNYNNYRFSLFVDLLARSLCYTNSIKEIQELDTLDISIVDKFKSTQAEYELAKDELAELGWLKDFNITLKLINKNIKNERYVLNTTAIGNLENQRNNERQPYFDIFGAFNSLGNDKFDLFARYINEAFKKCTDNELLSLLELWYLSYLSTKNQIDEKVLNYLNEGIEFEDSKDLISAEKQYEIATKLVTNFAPPLFYLGRIYHKKNEKFTAERYFAKALNIYPEYIEPRKYKIEFLMENRDYSDALAEVNSALSNCPFWYFYYQKANILYFLSRYSEATDILLNECIELNTHNYDQYILLGDIYLALGDLASAEKYILQAGELEPKNPIFIDRMKRLKELKLQEDK